MGKVIPSLIPFVLELPTWLFKRVANAMLKIDPQARSSMQDDLEARRLTEVDFLNGEVLRLATAMGQSAPVNKKVIALIREAESLAKGSPQLTGATLRTLASSS